MPKAFVYTELQVSIPFEQAPWETINPTLKALPGLIGKTWLSGYGNNSVGGLYEFDSLEHAQHFAQEYFPSEAKQLGVSFTTRVFDGGVTELASRDMNSAHFR